MKQIYLVSIFSVCYLFLFASGGNTTVGAGGAAMGGVSSTSQNVFSAHNNPAGIAYIKKISFGIFADRPFIVKGINNFNLSSVIPINKIGAFGLDINFLGYSAYNETRLGFSYARSFAEKISVGLKFDYLRMSIADNGSKNLFAFGVGLQYQPIKVLRFGAFVYNPISMTLSEEYKEKLATNFVIGFSYLPSEKLTISLDADKELNEKMRLKAGFEYKAMKMLFFRIGAATNPTLLSFGLGTEFKGFKLDVAASYDLKLGITPQISLVYKIDKRNKIEKK